jgi:SAM-dependent methyltransferase
VTDPVLSPSTCDEATLAYYREHAPTYVAAGPGGVSRQLARFLMRLPAGARILELGCGGGVDAEAMVAAGFEVDATEGVEAIARKAQERLGRPVRLMRFDQLDVHGAYDAVWASASLIHAPRAALPDILLRIFQALKPDGFHVATYKSGADEGRDRSGRYFNYPDEGWLREAYRRSAPWCDLELCAYTGGGFDHGQGQWLAVTARRGRACDR